MQEKAVCQGRFCRLEIIIYKKFQWKEICDIWWGWREAKRIKRGVHKNHEECTSSDGLPFLSEEDFTMNFELRKLFLSELHMVVFQQGNTEQITDEKMVMAIIEKGLLEDVDEWLIHTCDFRCEMSRYSSLSSNSPFKFWVKMGKDIIDSKAWENLIRIVMRFIHEMV